MRADSIAPTSVASSEASAIRPMRPCSRWQRRSAHQLRSCSGGPSGSKTPSRGACRSERQVKLAVFGVFQSLQRIVVVKTSG